MSLLSNIVGQYLIDSGNKIKNGECGYSDEELQQIAKSIIHNKMYMKDLEHRLGVSRRTVERWCHDGLLPPLRDDGDHHKYLWHDELEEWILSHPLHP